MCIIYHRSFIYRYSNLDEINFLGGAMTTPDELMEKLPKRIWLEGFWYVRYESYQALQKNLHEKEKRIEELENLAKIHTEQLDINSESFSQFISKRFELKDKIAELEKKNEDLLISILNLSHPNFKSILDENNSLRNKIAELELALNLGGEEGIVVSQERKIIELEFKVAELDQERIDNANALTDACERSAFLQSKVEELDRFIDDLSFGRQDASLSQIYFYKKCSMERLQENKDLESQLTHLRQIIQKKDEVEKEALETAQHCINNPNQNPKNNLIAIEAILSRSLQIKGEINAPYSNDPK